MSNFDFDGNEILPPAKKPRDPRYDNLDFLPFLKVKRKSVFNKDLPKVKFDPEPITNLVNALKDGLLGRGSDKDTTQAVMTGLLGAAGTTVAASAPALARGAVPKGQVAALAPMSKVNPALHLELVGSGKAPEAIREAYNALPMLNNNGKLMQDWWVPANSRPYTMNPEIYKKIQLLGNEGSITVKYGDIVRGQGAVDEAKITPELYERPVQIVARPAEHGSGFYTPGMQEITLFVDPSKPTFGKDLLGVLSHEGTHFNQELFNLPSGQNYDSVKKKASDARWELNRKQDLLEEQGVPFADNIIAAARRGALDPEDVFPAAMEHGEKYNDLMRATFFGKLDMGPQPKSTHSGEFRLYRGSHGEQVADGARMFEMGEKPGFTTPLVKQYLRQDDVLKNSTILKLAAAAELNKQGIFDPLVTPYSLPTPYWHHRSNMVNAPDAPTEDPVKVLARLLMQQGAPAPLVTRSSVAVPLPPP